MPKYLCRASYNTEGMKGLLRDGGTKRRQTIVENLKALDGRLESLYFAFGDTDVFLIAELPNNSAAATLSLNVAASGFINICTTVLIEPEEVDSVVNRKFKYIPPGAAR